MPAQLSSRRNWLRAGATTVAVLALAACDRTFAATGIVTTSGSTTTTSLAARSTSTAAAAVVSHSTVFNEPATAPPAGTAVSTTAATTVPSKGAAEIGGAAPPHGALVVRAAPPAPAGVLAAPLPQAAAVSPAQIRQSVVVNMAPARASLGPLEHITQTLNNCGPASVAEVLNYWGTNRSQGQVQAFLRADGNPNGMVPYGVPSYARSLGFGAILGTGGSRALIKALVANGIPPIVNQWVSITNHVGHYRPIEGFDDQSGVFVSSDPFLGAGHQIDYATFDRIWATNSGRFILLYPLAKQATIQAVLAYAGWSTTTAYQNDLAKLQRRLAQHRSSGDSGSQYWQGHGALAVAWDNLELGQIAAARTALAGAKAQGANTVIVNWIAQAIAAGTT